MSRTNTDRRDILIYSLAGVIPVVWIALLIAPYWNGNLFEVFENIDEILKQPLHIQWTDVSLRAVFFCLLAYAMGIFIWLKEKKHLDWVENFAVAGSMLIGMLVVVLVHL